MTQKNRIAAYLDTVMEKSMSGESQSMIFEVDAALVGGSNGTCKENYSAANCSETNNSCTNYGEACKGSSNVACSNPIPPGSGTYNSGCTINACKG